MTTSKPAYPRGVRTPISDQQHQLLAILEAEVGSLLEFLPVPLIVTYENGTIRRLNEAAGLLLGLSENLTGKHVENVLRERNLSVRVRLLRHNGEGLRLYVLHDS